MSTNVWGPPTWILFHTLIAKLTDDGFNTIGLQLFRYIKRICNNLPCPDCAQHATQFLSRVNMTTIKTKALQSFGLQGFIVFSCGAAGS